MTALRTALVVLLVSLAGCTVAPPTADGDASAGLGDEWDWPDDPPSDRLGWESGRWHNESIAVDQSDGLNATEREAFVARTMARVEVVRNREFERDVPVEVVSREEYRSSSPFAGGTPPERSAWNNQVWEALLLVGEDRNVTSVLGNLYDGTVQGYYAPGEDRIVIVSDSSQPAIGRATLAHELVHALQDQQFGMPPVGETQDGQLARNGIVEGDARYVERLYERRCGAQWDCVANPQNGGRGGGSVDMGTFVTIYTPYSEGPTLVHRLRQRGGWKAVDATYEEPPASTEQLLHPAAYPDEAPTTVAVPDRSGPSWSRFNVTPESDTVGEASLFAAAWTNGAVERSQLGRNPGPFSQYNYTAAATAGWAGDAVVPYRSDGGEYGYVFRTEWDTPRDAEQFARAYVEILRTRHDARTVGESTYVVENGSFADAFRVERNGTTVTVVNAPTVEQLDDVHGS